jgi:hypothetical protein
LEGYEKSGITASAKIRRPITPIYTREIQASRRSFFEDNNIDLEQPTGKNEEAISANLRPHPSMPRGGPSSSMRSSRSSSSTPSIAT